MIRVIGLGCGLLMPCIVPLGLALPVLSAVEVNYIRRHQLTCVGNMTTLPHDESSDTYLSRPEKELCMQLNLKMNW